MLLKKFVNVFKQCCYELIKAIPMIQVLRPKGEFAIMFDMFEKRAS